MCGLFYSSQRERKRERDIESEREWNTPTQSQPLTHLWSKIYKKKTKRLTVDNSLMTSPVNSAWCLCANVWWVTCALLFYFAVFAFTFTIILLNPQFVLAFMGHHSCRSLVTQSIARHYPLAFVRFSSAFFLFYYWSYFSLHATRLSFCCSFCLIHTVKLP